MSEFDLIATYFTWTSETSEKKNIVKAVGDDAAVLELSPNQQLVTSIDTLVSGVHFPAETSPFDIGHKALAVNLSDLAAMGANPEWFTLALTLPMLDHEWLGEFSRGLKTLADEAGIALVGGDTTSGPLAISIQVMGSVEKGKALMRSGAKQGDKIFVSGTLGDGAAGLQSLQGKLSLNAADASYCQQRLNRPTARLKESQTIKDFATACIDVSDGLLQDLNHILNQSNKIDENRHLGGQLSLEDLPLSKALKTIDSRQALDFALSGGDDYEILFTVPEDRVDALMQIASKEKLSITCIGEIVNTFIDTSINTDANKNGIVDSHGNAITSEGFNHFLIKE